MACKLPMALNTDMRSIAFRYWTFIILFLTSYYIVSKWWPTSEWKKKELSFFRSQISVAAGQRGRSLLLSSLDMTLFTASHTCDVSHAWPKSERFQNGRWLSVKKLVLHNISFICSSRILWPKRNVLGQKKQTNKQTKKEKFGVSYSLNHQVNNAIGRCVIHP